MKLGLQNSSVISPQKRRQSYLRKLNEQIDTVRDQVNYFKIRNETKRVSKYDKNPITLKMLSQPKFQNFILDENFNPQQKKVKRMQKKNMLNNLFRNNSTISESEFGANEQMMERSNYFGGPNRSILTHTSTQAKLKEKKKQLDKEWVRVESFRKKNNLTQRCETSQTKVMRNSRLQSLGTHRGDERINKILSKIELKRPSTAPFKNLFTETAHT